MAKPIFIVRLNEGHKKEKDPNAILEALRKSVNDEYHILLVFGQNKEPEFETLNADNLEPIELEQIKQIVNG